MKKLVVIFSFLMLTVAHRRNDLRLVDRIPKCIPLDDLDSRSSTSEEIHHRNVEREGLDRDRTEQHLQLAQGVLLQVNLNIEKFARWYAEELRQRLIGGIGPINKNVADKIRTDIQELENKIVKIINQSNAEINRELIDLVNNTNADLLDAVIDIRNTNFDALVAALTAAAVTDAGPPVTVTLAIDTANDIVATYVRRLIEELERLFRRVTAAEKGLANKIIEDKLHNQLRDIEKLLGDFERKLENYLRELGIETGTLITLTINNSTRRFIGYIDELIKKIGVNILCILQGNRNGFIEPTLVNPSFRHNEKYTKD